MSMLEKIAFISIGIMGQPMVKRLLTAGYPLFIFARYLEVSKFLIETEDDD